MHNFEGILLVILMSGPLILLQRWLHHETQAVLLLLTRRSEIAVVLFSLLFLPGVFLHEASHFIMARILGVRTGRFSILPSRLADGRLQLGFVETTSVDFVRDSLIGSAPLLVGGIFVGYAGLSRLGIPALMNNAGGSVETWLSSLAALRTRPDFWLWFYLTFAVSSTMLPSASDRRAWLPLSLATILLVGVMLAAGAGPWLAVHLAEPLNQALRIIALVMGVALGIHLLMLIPVWLARMALTRLTGLKVVG